MENIQIRKKIKGQKAVTIALIVFPFCLLLVKFRESNLEITSLNDALMAGSLIVLIICGLFGLRNSLRKEKSLS